MNTRSKGFIPYARRQRIPNIDGMDLRVVSATFMAKTVRRMLPVGVVNANRGELASRSFCDC